MPNENHDNRDELNQDNPIQEELDESGKPKPDAEHDDPAASEELDEDGNPKAKADAEDAPDEVLGVSLDGDEPAPDEDAEELAKAPKWVRDLRHSHKEVKRQLKAANEEINRLKTPTAEPKPADVGPKPTLEGCDFDEAKYETELDAWMGRKRKADEAQAAAEAEREQARKGWEQKLQQYEERKGKLKLPDLDEAEDRAKEKLSLTQQGIIVHGAKDPALLMYAVGRNPKKLDDLAKVQDPVQFAFAVANLERDMKVTTGRRPSKDPEGGEVRGSTTTKGVVDSELERLRDEAARTGDYTKVTAYKAKARAKGSQ